MKKGNNKKITCPTCKKTGNYKAKPNYCAYCGTKFLNCLENKKQKQLEAIREIFNMEDYAKDLLINAKTEREEMSARMLLKVISKEFEKLYIPTPIENV